MDSSSILPALPSHDQHDPRWLQPGSRQGSYVCLACLTEMLEDKDMIGVKTKIVLVELLSVLGKDTVLHLLGENVPVHVHIAMILLEHLWHAEESLACLAVEALVQLLGAPGPTDLLPEVLENLAQMCTEQTIYKRNLPAFHFLGKILQKLPIAAKHVIQKHGNFMDYICSGLSNPDEAVQSALIYLLNHFYQPGCIQGVSAYVHKAVVQHLPKLIVSTKQQDLQMNIIGLLKLALSQPHLTQQLMLSNNDGTTLAAGLKKLLICQRDVLQIATVQCISQILVQDQGRGYADDFLLVDVAEFLFESLATTNEILLGSICCCLLQLTESEIFFQNHHSVYGLESILRGIEQALRQRNPITVTPAIKLLAVILERHAQGISLFSHQAMLTQAMLLITDGIKLGQPTVAQTAIRALQHVIRHCPVGPLPLQELLQPLQHLKQQTSTVLQDLANDKKRYMSKKRDRKGSQRRQDKVEDTLEQLIKVFTAVSEYVCKCLEDPMSDHIPNSASNNGSENTSEPLTVAWLAEFLVQGSDEICIPLTMIYCEGNPNVLVLQSVYSFLCLQYKFKLPDMLSLSKKYAQTEFVSFTIETKGKFRDNNLQKVIEEFLIHVCTGLFSAHHEYADLTHYRTQLTQGLRQVQGLTEDLVALFLERDDNESTWVLSAQIVAISVFYFETNYTNTSRLEAVSTTGYFEALSRFILSRHDLSSLPDYSWWQIMYLWAVVSKDLMTQQDISLHHQFRALSVLTKVAKDLTVNDSLITRSSTLLVWTFSDGDLAEFLGNKMLKLWLTSAEKSGDNIFHEELVSMVMENQLCLHSLLNLVSLGEEEVTKVAVNLLKEALEKGLREKEDATVLGDLEESINKTTQQMCLAGKDWEVPSHNLVAMFEILAQLKKQHCALVKPTSADMKLLYHAICITKNDAIKERLHAALLAYLCCVLVQSNLQNDVQASSLLLSDSDFLHHLHSSVTSASIKISSSSCIILSVLMLQQHCNTLKIPAQTSDAVEIVDLMGLLTSRNMTSQAAVLCLCSSYFATDCCPQVLTIRGRKPCVVPHPKDLPWHIDTHHIRMFFICLQQVITQSGDFVCRYALDCMKNLMSHLIRCRNELGIHIQNHPWNSFMIEMALDPPDETLGIAFLWPHLLEMVADGPSILLLFTDSLSKAIIQKIDGFSEDEQNDEDKDMVASLVILMEKLLTCPWYYISDEKRFELKRKVNYLNPVKERYRLDSMRKAWSLLLNLAVEA